VWEPFVRAIMARNCRGIKIATGTSLLQNIKTKACSAVWEPFVRAIMARNCRGIKIATGTSLLQDKDIADTIRSHRT
jgi:hypothetical protein